MKLSEIFIENEDINCNFHSILDINKKFRDTSGILNEFVGDLQLYKKINNWSQCSQINTFELHDLGQFINVKLFSILTENSLEVELRFSRIGNEQKVKQ